MTIAIVTAVYRTGPSLPELVARLRATMTRPWTLRLVVDACPAGGDAAADALAALNPELHVLHLPTNVGQHRALAAGLQLETDAAAWVCLDSDLQDPPEAIPVLLEELFRTNSAAVFAGRRGRYESLARLASGEAHRAVIAALTGTPRDAGAFFVMDARMRSMVVSGVLERGCPSVVVAAGAAGLPTLSVPVPRERRTIGESAWTTRARLRQSVRSIAWSIRKNSRVTG